MSIPFNDPAIFITLSMAFSIPFPPYLFSSLSWITAASCSPAELPKGTEAFPRMPFCNVIVVSSVGNAPALRISLAFISLIEVSIFSMYKIAQEADLFYVYNLYDSLSFGLCLGQKKVII